MSALEIVTLINDEDASVLAVIRPALPAIAAAVDDITERLRHGGRLVYAGAADQEVKVAVLRGIASVDAPDARTRLEEAGGVLRLALGEPAA